MTSSQRAGTRERAEIVAWRAESFGPAVLNRRGMAGASLGYVVASRKAPFVYGPKGISHGYGKKSARNVGNENLRSEGVAIG